jgi:hypothetical protein
MCTCRWVGGVTEGMEYKREEEGKIEANALIESR